MRKLFFGLPLAGVIAFIALLYFSRQGVEARWFGRDSTAVNPLSICRDGMYIGVGHESQPGPVTVTAILEADGTEVFSREYNNLTSHPTEDPPYQDYFRESWNPEDRPLAAGTVITLAGGSDNPVVTVADCFVFSPDQATAGFSYQGVLYDDNSPANGNYDLLFYAWDAPTGGEQVGNNMAIDNVPVVDGTFTVKIDFGVEAVSTGRARWLEMRVRPGASTGSYTTLAPRQEMMAVPYAQTLEGGAMISATHADTALTIVNRSNQALDVSGGRVGLNVRNADDAGIRIESAGDAGLDIANASVGINVQDTWSSGLVLSNTGGLEVINGSGSALTRGAISVSSPQMNGISIRDAGEYGIGISDSESSGISISDPGSNGVSIFSPDNDGVRVFTPVADGVSVIDAGSNGLSIWPFFEDRSTVGDGISVYRPGWDGIYISESLDDGMHVSAAGYDGVYADSARTNGYGFYTFDRIYGSNVSATSLSLVAEVSGGEALQAGDIVAVVGTSSLAEANGALLPQVTRATAANASAVIGVVETRLDLIAVEREQVDAGDESPGREPGDEAPRLRPVEGPAAAGDHVSLIIYGVTNVRVDPSTQIEAGVRLTAAEANGMVRPLLTTTIDGTRLTEDAPVVGIALAPPEPGNNFVPVFVTVR